MVKVVESKRCTAFLFPGQGVQEVGMGMGSKDLLYEVSEAAHRVISEADKALGFSLSDLMFKGPAKELNRTVNAQPAILTVSLACFAAAKERTAPQALPEARFMAGHSLGEYTALAASGILEIGEAILLVRERGRLMQEACDQAPGSMAAILGLDEETMAEICKETGAQIANINTPGQIVISGTKKNVAKAIKRASKKGSKRAILLKVSGAFHSYLMGTALDGMIKAIDKVTFRNASVPVVANCSGKPITAAWEIKEELTQQLCGCVRWQDSITFMVNAGVNSFVEFGPGSTLTSMVRRIANGVSIANVNNAESAARFADNEMAPS